jgi:hypothetical protein
MTAVPVYGIDARASDVDGSASAAKAAALVTIRTTMITLLSKRRIRAFLINDPDLAW